MMIQLCRSLLHVCPPIIPRFQVRTVTVKAGVKYNYSLNVQRYSTGHSHSDPSQFNAVRLKSRSLVKLVGPDGSQLLQGLITNDTTHLENKGAMYALFLNNQGRVLWDSIIYKPEQGLDCEMFVECDSSIKDNLIKHLKTFRLRKKVDIVDLEENEGGMDLWVFFNRGHTTLMNSQGVVVQQPKTTIDFPISLDPSFHSFRDPRLPELGWRVIVPRNSSSSFPPNTLEISNEESYKLLRYVLGVAEGVRELPSANCFPLESNGDYLHGVSFHKGCYIGQELTARTHHTGVVRKRIMPFRLSEESNGLKDVNISTLQILSKKEKPLGKVRGICGSYGIGLIRIEEALSAQELTLQNNIKVNVKKPVWWPEEVSKEKQST